MNSTPLWVPLLVAAIGLLGTVAGTITGVLITQRRSDRREAAAWERERRRERELWAREDALRNFETRRDAMVRFYEVLRGMARAAYDHGMGLSAPPAEEDEGELPFEWNQSAFRALEHLRVFASPPVLVAASTAYSVCWQWGHATRYGHDDDEFRERQEIFDAAELTLHESIRADLGLESRLSDGAPLVGSGWEVMPQVSDAPPAARSAPGGAVSGQMQDEIL